MSAEAMAIALNHSGARGTAKLVLIGIANHDGDGGSWPSVRTLARYANVDERTVQRAIDTLVRLREIKRIENGGGGATTPGYLRPNLYHFLLECPPHCDRSRQHRDTRRGARYVPRYLDFDPVTVASPGDNDDTPPVTVTSPDPVTVASPELTLKNYTEKQSPERNAGARGDEGERSAPSVAEPPSQLTRCPKRGYMPCSIGRAHTCIDCGSVAVPWAQPEREEAA